MNEAKNIKKINKKKIIFVVIIITLIIVAIKSICYFMEKPQVKLIGDSNVSLTLGSEYKELGANATVHKKQINNKIQVKGEVDTSKVGKYSINYCINNKPYATRNIEVKDNIAPILELKGSKIINLKENTEYEETGYVAKDNYDGDITNNVITQKEDINEDEYKITYKVKDSSGNETKNERILIKNKPKQNESVIYLTFDDGPSLDITPHILDILKEEDIKATFFILDYNNKKEELVKREVEEGHSIGLHGVSHNYKEIYGSLENGLNNFINLNKKVKESTGIDTKLIRFPGGSSNTVSKFNPGIMTNLAMNLLEKVYKYYDWNVASGDSGDVKTKEAVYNNVTKGIRKNRNNIVLMHDFSGNSKTLNALRDIIKYGKANGYTFERITESTPMITQNIVN